MKKISKFYAVISLFLFSVFAAGKANAEKITFSANSMTGVVGDKSDSTTLNGEAYVLTDSMEIFADQIGLSGKNFRFIEAHGNIKGKNMESELEFTCDKLKYDRETKIAELSDNVDLKDIKNDVNAKAQIIEYNQNTETAVMQIEIQLTQKNNVCTGAYAIYRKNDQMLELSGNSQIKQGEDTFRAQQITLDLTSQEITLDGRVKGSIIDEKKVEKEAGETENTGAEQTEEQEKTKEQEKNEENAENISQSQDAENSSGEKNPVSQSTEDNTGKNTEKSTAQEKEE